MKHTLYLLFCLLAFNIHAQIITTVAGCGSSGYNGDNIPALHAFLVGPIGNALDKYGNLYISDVGRVRKISPAVGGVITTIAGDGTYGNSGDNGPATAAKLKNVYGVATDAIGNVYIVDVDATKIKKVDTNGIITTFAGNGTGIYVGDGVPATTTGIPWLCAMAIDKWGNAFITGKNVIWKVDTAGIITTVAGTGVGGYNGDGIAATAAELNLPSGVAIDTSDNIYITDALNLRVRKVAAIDGTISTIAGTGILGNSGDNGPATAAKFIRPYAITLDNNGNIYVGDIYGFVIRKIDQWGIISSYAGNDTDGFSGDNGPATNAEMGQVFGLTANKAGDLFISDSYYSRIIYVKNTLEVKEINIVINKIDIYPNPCKNKLIVNINALNDSYATIRIFDLIGVKVKELIIKTNQQAEIILNEPEGIYILEAIINEKIYHKEFMIIK